jgi:hypothetical protein
VKFIKLCEVYTGWCVMYFNYYTTEPRSILWLDHTNTCAVFIFNCNGLHGFPTDILWFLDNSEHVYHTSWPFFNGQSQQKQGKLLET